MRIATFNVQNMRLRPFQGGPKLDGAVDRDADIRADAALDRIDRALTAQVLNAVAADIVALQEVFDRATLDFFHDRWLMETGCAPYPHRICLPGNDGHGLNVAALSRLRPERIQSHADLTPADCPELALPPNLGPGRIFRRDCLELTFPGLSLFICHFKAPYPDADAAFVVRRAEAMAVRWIIEQRFEDPGAARWMILGDLNEPVAPGQHATGALDPLAGGFSIDLTGRPGAGQGWSFSTPDGHIRSCPDRILISPALDRLIPGLEPGFFRAGMDLGSLGDIEPHLSGVGQRRPHASDHAAVFVDIPEI